MTDLLQEDRGLVKLHSICIDMNAIWRPTPCHDLGVDGQIEFLDQGNQVTSTGKILAVQVKSGPSYFGHETPSSYRYYPTPKHRQYWSSLNLPIILVLHNPMINLTLFSTIKDKLQDSAITIPKDQLLSGKSRSKLLEIAVFSIDPNSVLESLWAIKVTIRGVQICGSDFLLACLHPSDSYFEIRMARFHAMLSSMANSDGLGIGQQLYDFILRFSMMCLGFEITENYLRAFDREWYELEMVPDIVVSLSPLGILVSQCLRENPERYLTVRRQLDSDFALTHLKRYRTIVVASTEMLPKFLACKKEEAISGTFVTLWKATKYRFR